VMRNARVMLTKSVVQSLSLTHSDNGTDQDTTRLAPMIDQDSQGDVGGTASPRVARISAPTSKMENRHLAIEAKSSAKITSDHLRGLRHLVRDHSKVKRRVIVCLEKKYRRTNDGIEILPVAKSVQRLAQGDLF
jgi:hypothetical protein